MGAGGGQLALLSLSFCSITKSISKSLSISRSRSLFLSSPRASDGGRRFGATPAERPLRHATRACWAGLPDARRRKARAWPPASRGRRQGARRTRRGPRRTRGSTRRPDPSRAGPAPARRLSGSGADSDPATRVADSGGGNQTPTLERGAQSARLGGGRRQRSRGEDGAAGTDGAHRLLAAREKAGEAAALLCIDGGGPAPA